MAKPTDSNQEKVIQDLRNSLAWLDLALATLQEGVMVLDGDMKILFANDAAADMIGTSRILLLGSFIWNALPLSESGVKLDRTIYLAIRSQPAHKKIYELMVDSSTASIEVATNYIAASGHTILVLREMTTLLVAEAQRMKALQERAARQAAEYSAQRVLIQYKAASLFASSNDKSYVIKKIMKNICEDLQWQVGIFWTVDSTGQGLHCTQWYSPLKSMTPFINASKEITFRRGFGQPGTVWQKNEPKWAEDFTVDAIFSRKDIAAKLDLHGSFGVPVGNGDQFIGVMEFFTERTVKPDQDLLTTMTTIGIQLAQYLQRIKSEADLKRNENKFRALTEKSAEVVSLVNAEGKVTYTSPAVKAMLGYTPNELAAMTNPFELIHPEDRDWVLEAYNGMVQSPGNIIAIEYRTKHKDGRYVWTDATATNLLHDPDVQAVVSNYRDISERKKAEEQILRMNEQLEQRVHDRTAELTIANKELKRSNTELEDFAYVASHDLQEPLRKISAFSNLLENDYKHLLPEDAQYYLTALQRASTRMSTLLTDMLMYSRVTTQAQPFESIDLNLVIKDVIEDLQIRIVDTKADIKIGKLCTVEGDRLQMRLLLQNLLSNALKYIKEGTPPKITVTCKKQKNRCVLSVQDNGIGFDEIYLDRIFTIFQRLHGKGEYQGTGVGLAICKKIVDRHEGSITARSKVDKGANFIVELPIQQSTTA